MFRSASIIVLLLHVSSRNAAASHPALDETKATGLCKVAAELLKAPGLALQKYTDLQQQAAAAAQAALLAGVAASTEDSVNVSTVFRAIALAAEKCALDAAESISSLAQTTEKTTANAAKASGHIAELIDLLRKGSYNAGGGRTTWCLGAAEAATTKATIQQMECPADYIASLTPVASLQDSVISEAGYAGLSPGSAKLGGTGATSCGLLIAADNGATNIWMTASPAAQPAAGGFLTLQPHSVAGTADYTVSSVQTGANSGAFANPTTTPQKIYNDIKQLEKHTVRGCGGDIDAVIKHAITANSASTLLQEVLQTQEPYKSQKNAAQAAKDMIKEAADNSDTDQESKIVKKIKIQTAERIQQDKTATKKLSDANTADDNMRTLLLNHLKKREKLGKLASDLEKAKDTAAKAPHVPKPDDCKGKKGTECKDGCELVEGVCKPVKKGEGENKEKTGTTNTTGSNSFVIKKVPLVLAFLLF